MIFSGGGSTDGRQPFGTMSEIMFSEFQGHEGIDGLTGQGQIGTIWIHLAVLEQRALQVCVDEVVIELQHAHLGVLQNEKSNMYGQGVLDGFLVQFYLVRIVADDVELSDLPIVDHERCRLLRTVVDVTMSVHVVDGLSVVRVPQQLHAVRDDGLVSVNVSLATSRGHCIAEPPETRNRIVLDDLIDVRHLETVVQIPSQQGRCEQYLIASITAHEHAPRSRQHVVLVGVSAYERTEIVARQTDVLEHGLHLGKVLTHFIQYANVALDHAEHGSGTHAA